MFKLCNMSFRGECLQMLLVDEGQFISIVVHGCMVDAAHNVVQNLLSGQMLFWILLESVWIRKAYWSGSLGSGGC